MTKKKAEGPAGRRRRRPAPWRPDGSLTGNTWRAPLDGAPGWVVEATLVAVDGQLTVGEFAIKPADPDAVPAEGVTSTLLRQVRVTKVVEDARQAIQAISQMTTLSAELDADGEITDLGFRPFGALYPELGDLAAALPSRPGRGGHEDEFYVPWAVAYAKKLATLSRSPIKDIAADHSLDASQVRDLIHEARRRDLLTPVDKGRAGGKLTDKARSLLADMNEAEG